MQAADPARENRKISGVGHALVIILPSRGCRDNGGSGGTIFDDGSLDLVHLQARTRHSPARVVTAIESYARV